MDQLQQYQFLDKYARFNPEKGRRETWEEAVKRVVDFLSELSDGKLSFATLEKIHDAILNGDVMPSMRLMAMAGEPARRNNAVLYNCFSRDTKFLTDVGVRSFLDYSDGDSVIAKTHTGEWKPAIVRHYGDREMNTVTIKRIKQKRSVSVTPNHRWILNDGSQTTDLSVGDFIESMPAYEFSWDAGDPMEKLYWCYGMVFGDGTKVKHNGTHRYSMIRLCGSDADYESRFLEVGFKSSTSSSLSGDVMCYTGGYLKTLPDIETDSPQLIRAFLSGWLSADGGKNRSATQKSEYNSIVFTGNDKLAWLKDALPMSGIFINRIDDISGQKTNFGTRKPNTYRLGMTTNMVSDSNNHAWRVVSIEPDEIKGAWCLEVFDDRSFVLPELGVVTGNCSYLPVDSLESFVEMLSISMGGTGVGYSVERRYTDLLPVIEEQKPYQLPAFHKVQDSSEGWAQALRIGLQTWFYGYDIEFDYSQVRPQGAPLKTKGGQASGPEPLRRLLDYSRDVILSKQGEKLSPLDCHDIATMVADCVVSGGVRRSAMIALFDRDDEEMRTCKDPDKIVGNYHRYNANNSAVWLGRVTKEEVAEQIHAMHFGGNGEPAIFSRTVAKSMKPRRRKMAEFGTNPCGEIILRPRQFCNLTTAVAKHDDTVLSLSSKVSIATIIGTVQSSATYFPHLSDEWRENCEEERLLGVDINGQMDCPLFTDDNAVDTMTILKNQAILTNRAFSGILGINPSVAVTCVKPSGNSSVLLNCSAGLHPRHSAYYIRRLRVSKSSNMYWMLHLSGFDLTPENNQDEKTATTYVAKFYVKSPDGAIVRGDYDAVQQLNYWLSLKQRYTEHNPSATISYREDELDGIINWIYDNQQSVNGVSFLPISDIMYDQPPYEAITREQYEAGVAATPEIRFDLLDEMDNGLDQTTSAQELACMAGNCEI